MLTFIIKEEKLNKARQKELPKFSYRRVVRYLSGYYHYLGFGIIGAIIVGGVQPVFAFLLAKVIVILLTPNKAEISPGPLEGANLYAFLFGTLVILLFNDIVSNNIAVVLGIGAFIGAALQLTSFERTSAVLTRKLRRKTFNRLLKQEVQY